MEKYSQEEIDLKIKFETTSEAINYALNKQQKDYENQLGIQKESFEDFMKGAKNDQDNVNRTYSEFMSLKAPVKFWKDKKKFAYIQASVITVVFMFMLYFSGEFLLAKGNDLLALKKDDFHYGKVSYFLFLAFIVFWLLRILVQILLSRLHLAAEASEKSVMTEAYLSLLEEGKVNEQERELVLRNVFRPSGSGLIKDDNSHPALEIINKILKKE